MNETYRIRTSIGYIKAIRTVNTVHADKYADWMESKRIDSNRNDPKRKEVNINIFLSLVIIIIILCCCFVHLFFLSDIFFCSFAFYSHFQIEISVNVAVLYRLLYFPYIFNFVISVFVLSYHSIGGHSNDLWGRTLLHVAISC